MLATCFQVRAGHPARMSAAPEQRFSDRVGNYIRYRPGYPPAVLAALQKHAGLTTRSVTADIGSGTGLSAGLFLRFGCQVHAVEPNREMREAAERLLAGEPRFHSVSGTAQATTLPDQSADLIIAAQAFHWFNTPETRAEFTRILKPDGHIVLIWNERKLDATPFLRGIPAGRAEVLDIQPGVIPGTIPAADQWAELGFNIRRFEPPRLGPAFRDRPLPHVNLDKVLQFLLA